MNCNRNWFTFGILFLVTVIGESKDLDNIKAVFKKYSQSTYVSNEHELVQKISAIISDGVSKLQIITDFDNTLTLDAGIEGKRVLNTFEMFRLCPSVPQTYKNEEYQLYQKYKHVESDPSLSLEEKSRLMIEWYRAAHNLMKGIAFPGNELKELAHNMTDRFRSGIQDVLSWSNDNNVPITILSSGLGDALTATLEVANLTSPNIKVISNFLDINSEGIIIGMKGEPIHSFNKNEASIKATDYFDKIKNRKNVILMGDTLGDANMADGLEDLNDIVKMAFLSKKRENKLGLYTENFDIVLFDDQTLNVLLSLLKLIS